ncbi:MAG: NTPase [candidate division WOR-3 bacterium]
MAKILIRGRPGIGKTTLIKKVVENFKERGKKVFGFYTEEIREKGMRVGFKVVGLTEGEEVMAHINFFTPYQISKYKVDLKRFEKIALPELERGLRKRGVIVIDEIGKMELFSEKFRALVSELFKEKRAIIATIPIAQIPFLSELLRIPDVQVIEITLANREGLKKELPFISEE